MAGKRKSESKRWFHQALYDLKAARWNLQGGFHNTVCFLAQQSAEKALKSLLYYLGARRQALLTHSLVDMVQEVGSRVTRVAGLAEEARELDLHYIPSRYPNGLPSGYPHQFYTKAIAEEALAAADKILTTVRNHYESEDETEILTVAES